MGRENERIELEAPCLSVSIQISSQVFIGSPIPPAAHRSCISAEQAGRGIIQGKHPSEFHLIATEVFAGPANSSVKLHGTWRAR